MNKGKFVNRKLAKRPGRAQRQARLGLEAGKGRMLARSPKKERVIIESGRRWQSGGELREK